MFLSQHIKTDNQGSVLYKFCYFTMSTKPWYKFQDFRKITKE